MIIDRLTPIRLSTMSVIIESMWRFIMGAIAVSKKEGQQIERLREEIRESVRRCAAADRREHQELAQAAVGRDAADA